LFVFKDKGTIAMDWAVQKPMDRKSSKG